MIANLNLSASAISTT